MIGSVSQEDVDAARRVILEHGWNATCYQILNPGFERWFSADRDAVVGFVRHGRYHVVGGAPICHPNRLADVASAFEAWTRSCGKWTCYFGAEARLERVRRDATGYAVMLLGGQPHLDPRDWPARIDAHASLRRQLHRAANKGVVIEEWDPARARDHPQLRACLEDWLATRGLPPLHFLIETETLLHFYDRRVFVALREASVLAFLVASPIPARNGWLVEQLVRGHAAVNGTSELLIDAVLRAVASAGSTYVSLGLAPLSHRVDRPRQDNPRWLRSVLAWLRRHGTRSYNFAGLEDFKAKFRPDHWDPVYAIVDRPAIYPSMLYAIGSAFAQGSPVLLLGRALRKAALRKLRALAG